MKNYQVWGVAVNADGTPTRDRWGSYSLLRCISDADTVEQGRKDAATYSRDFGGLLCPVLFYRSGTLLLPVID